ncbi:MAG: transglutaminase domain-containing protein [Oscillospiraceae bacterium]|jgi:hypothetical protein|nr:transglutaminase domain-containing protein [Oscillospiraceae bacterium]
MSIESNPVQAPKGGAGAVKIAAAILLSGCLIASLGLNIYQAAVQNQKVSEYIDHELERQAEEAKKENEYMEDGYRVGGEYEIRSTTHISDAYLSGDSSLLSPEDEETLSMAEAVLSEVIEEGMSRYEQEEAVYLWLVSNIGRNSSGVISRPGMSRSAFTPHDVLASRSAVCVGYATTFRLFMNMLGMDCRIVHNEYHSWNLVRLDDGWYHVDVYSDTHGVPYENFNMTDLVAKAGHSWDESALPEAKSVTYTPAVQNSIQVDGVLDVPAALKGALDGRNRALFFQFKHPLTDEDMDMVEFLAIALEGVLSGMLEDSYYFRAAWYPGEGDSYILGLLLESHRIEEEESDGIDAGSPEGQEIIRAIAAAFDVDPVALGGHPTQSEFPTDAPADVPGAVFTRSGAAAIP